MNIPTPYLNVEVCRIHTALALPVTTCAASALVCLDVLFGVGSEVPQVEQLAGRLVGRRGGGVMLVVLKVVVMVVGGGGGGKYCLLMVVWGSSGYASDCRPQ